MVTLLAELILSSFWLGMFVVGGIALMMIRVLIFILVHLVNRTARSIPQVHRIRGEGERYNRPP